MLSFSYQDQELLFSYSKLFRKYYIKQKISLLVGLCICLMLYILYALKKYDLCI